MPRRERFRRARRSRRRRRLLFARRWVAAGGGGGAAAWAQIPVTDVAHIAVNSSWHYAHYVRFALQIAQQYQELLNQYTQIRAQLLALRKLANPQ